MAENTPGAPNTPIDTNISIVENLSAMTDIIAGMQDSGQMGQYTTNNGNQSFDRSGSLLGGGGAGSGGQDLSGLNSSISNLNNSIRGLTSTMGDVDTNQRDALNRDPNTTGTGAAGTGASGSSNAAINTMGNAVSDGIARAMKSDKGKQVLEYQGAVNSGRQPGVLPYRMSTMLAEMPDASVLPGQSPLSVMDRLERTKGIQAGLTVEGINPSQFGAQAAANIQQGQAFKKDITPDQQRIIMGSLKRSMEYVREKGAQGDEVRSTAAARSSWQNLAENTGMSNADFQAADVGMAQRMVRNQQGLSGAATSSLNKYAQGFQTMGHSYRSVISMDAPGGMITKNTVNADTMGTYVQDTVSSLQGADAMLVHKDSKGAAAQDLGRKVTAINDSIAGALNLDSVQRSIQSTMGSEKGGQIVQDINNMQQAHSEAERARSKALRKEAEAAKQKVIMDSKDTSSDEKKKAKGEFAKASDAAQIASAEATKQNAIRNDLLQNVQGNMAPSALRQMSKSGDSDTRRFTALQSSYDDLSQRQRVIAGDAPISRTEKVTQGAKAAAGAGGQMAAMNMQNLQWALMFAFSGTVFQALSQMPSEASYKAVTPAYAAVGNITGITPLFQEMSQFPQQAGAIMSDLQTRTNTLSSLLGTQQGAQQAVGKALDISKEQPVQFGEAMEIMTAMATYPSTRASAKDPEFQTKMFETVQLLSMLAPEQGTGGALFAMREMLGGQFRSLQMRFNISPELLAGYAGTTTSKLKGGTGTELIESMHSALTNLFGGPEILMKRGAQMDVQLNNIGDVLTSAVIKPLVMDRQEGLVSTLDNIMGETGPDIKQDSILGGLERMIAPRQVEAIESSALGKTAAMYGIDRKKGDTLDTILSRVKPEEKERFKQEYKESAKESARSLYTTPAGGAALAMTAVASSLDSVMSSFDISKAFGNIQETNIQNMNSRMATFNQATTDMDTGAKFDSQQGRQQVAKDLVNGILDDIQNQIRGVGDTMGQSGLKDIISKVADTAREGAEMMFAPVARVIMAQTAKTAIQLPSMLIGGAMEMGTGATVNALGSMMSGEGNMTAQQGLGLASGAANMASWGSLMLAQKTPWKAAQHFTAMSAAGRGFDQLGSGQTMAGIGNLGLSVAIETVPMLAAASGRRVGSTYSGIKRMQNMSGAAKSFAGVRALQSKQSAGLDWAMAGVMGGGQWLAGAATSKLSGTNYMQRRAASKAAIQFEQNKIRDVQKGRGVYANMGTSRRDATISTIQRGIDAKRSAAPRLIGGGIAKGMKGVGLAGMALTAGMGIYDLMNAPEEQSDNKKWGSRLQTLGGLAMSGSAVMAASGVGAVPAALTFGLGGAATMLGGWLGDRPEEDSKTKEQIDKVKERTATMEDYTFESQKKQLVSVEANKWSGLVKTYKMDEVFSDQQLQGMKEKRTQKIIEQEDTRAGIYFDAKAYVDKNAILSESQKKDRSPEQQELYLEQRKANAFAQFADFNSSTVAQMVESPGGFVKKDAKGEVIGEGGSETLTEDAKGTIAKRIKQQFGGIEGLDLSQMTEDVTKQIEKAVQESGKRVKVSQEEFAKTVAPQIRKKWREDRYMEKYTIEEMPDIAKMDEQEYKGWLNRSADKQDSSLKGGYKLAENFAMMATLTGGDGMAMFKRMTVSQTRGELSKLRTGQLSIEELQDQDSYSKKISYAGLYSKELLEQAPEGAFGGAKDGKGIQKWIKEQTGKQLAEKASKIEKANASQSKQREEMYVMDKDSYKGQKGQKEKTTSTSETTSVTVDADGTETTTTTKTTTKPPENEKGGVPSAKGTEADKIKETEKQITEKSGQGADQSKSLIAALDSLAATIQSMEQVMCSCEGASKAESVKDKTIDSDKITEAIAKESKNKEADTKKVADAVSKKSEKDVEERTGEELAEYGPKGSKDKKRTSSKDDDTEYRTWVKQAAEKEGVTPEEFVAKDKARTKSEGVVSDGAQKEVTGEELKVDEGGATDGNVMSLGAAISKTREDRLKKYNAHRAKQETQRSKTNTDSRTLLARMQVGDPRAMNMLAPRIEAGEFSKEELERARPHIVAGYNRSGKGSKEANELVDRGVLAGTELRNKITGADSKGTAIDATGIERNISDSAATGKEYDVSGDGFVEKVVTNDVTDLKTAEGQIPEGESTKAAKNLLPSVPKTAKEAWDRRKTALTEGAALQKKGDIKGAEAKFAEAGILKTQAKEWDDVDDWKTDEGQKNAAKDKLKKNAAERTTSEQEYTKYMEEHTMPAGSTARGAYNKAVGVTKKIGMGIAHSAKKGWRNFSDTEAHATIRGNTTQQQIFGIDPEEAEVTQMTPAELAIKQISEGAMTKEQRTNPELIKQVIAGGGSKEKLLAAQKEAFNRETKTAAGPGAANKGLNAKTLAARATEQQAMSELIDKSQGPEATPTDATSLKQAVRESVAEDIKKVTTTEKPESADVLNKETGEIEETVILDQADDPEAVIKDAKGTKDAKNPIINVQPVLDKEGNKISSNVTTRDGIRKNVLGNADIQVAEGQGVSDKQADALVNANKGTIAERVQKKQTESVAPGMETPGLQRSVSRDKKVGSGQYLSKSGILTTPESSIKRRVAEKGEIEQYRGLRIAHGGDQTKAPSKGDSGVWDRSGMDPEERAKMDKEFERKDIRMPEDGSYRMKNIRGSVARVSYAVPKPKEGSKNYEKEMEQWEQGKEDFFQAMGGGGALEAGMPVASMLGDGAKSKAPFKPKLNVGRIIPPEYGADFGSSLLGGKPLGVPSFQDKFQKNFMNTATKSQSGGSKDVLMGSKIVIQNAGGIGITNT